MCRSMIIMERDARGLFVGAIIQAPVKATYISADILFHWGQYEGLIVTPGECSFVPRLLHVNSHRASEAAQEKVEKHQTHSVCSFP